MFNWQQNFKQQQPRFCWTLGNKIGGLATFFLVLLGGISCYFYFEIIEISQEVEEIGQSDFPLYDNVTQLLLYQEQKRALLEKIDYIQNYAPERSLNFAEIADQFSRIEQAIHNSLSEGVKQSDFAFEQEKGDNIRLNQAVEDYQQLKTMFLQLELKNQKFNLIIKQLMAVANSNQSSPKLSSQQLLLLTNLIQQAKVELKTFNQLTLEIQQRIKNHIEGSVVATVDERSIAIKTTALIYLGALLLGLAFSTWIINQITSSVNKVTRQAKFIADNIEQETLESEALVVDSQDEIRDLTIAFNQMVENFLFSQAERKKIAQQLLSEKKLGSMAG
ncbi:MAG: HAMP domain-containing protein [Cyanobacteria bacterium P01_G01_bin.39]